MRPKRSQLATETLILLAGALTVLLIIFVANSDIMSSFNARLRHTKAKIAVNDMGDSAELVHQQGIGSKTKTYISLPDSISASTISNKTIAISFHGDVNVVYRTLRFNVTGTIPTSEGSYWICVESMHGYVSINDCNA
jgi:hypothetical protein